MTNEHADTERADFAMTRGWTTRTKPRRNRKETVMANAGTSPTGNASPKPAPYGGFDGQYINGSWRAG